MKVTPCGLAHNAPAEVLAVAPSRTELGDARAAYVWRSQEGSGLSEDALLFPPATLQGGVAVLRATVLHELSHLVVEADAEWADALRIVTPEGKDCVRRPGLDDGIHGAGFYSVNVKDAEKLLAEHRSDYRDVRHIIYLGHFGFEG